MKSEVVQEIDSRFAPFYTFDSLGEHGENDWRSHGSVKTPSFDEIKHIAKEYAFIHRTKVRILRVIPEETSS